MKREKDYIIIFSYYIKICVEVEVLVEPVLELNAVLIREGERPDVLERRLVDGLYTNKAEEGDIGETLLRRKFRQIGPGGEENPN